MSSTEKGYINENNQKNIGKTDKKGTGNFQWFYDMECLNCGNKYYPTITSSTATILKCS